MNSASGIDLEKSENLIFHQYRVLHPEKPILPDGTVDPASYLKPDNFRMVFLLKEANDPDGNWARNGGDLRTLARSGGRYASWHNLATWIALANKEQVTIQNRRDPDWRSSQLRKAVFVNAKKIPGGAHSFTPEIVKFALAQENSILLKRQLELYRPHVTLACGNGLFSILEKLFEAKAHKPDTSPYGGKYGYWFFRNKHMGTVIDFYHPQTRQIGGWSVLGEMINENLRHHFPDRYSE